MIHLIGTVPKQIKISTGEQGAARARLLTCVLNRGKPAAVIDRAATHAALADAATGRYMSTMKATEVSRYDQSMLVNVPHSEVANAGLRIRPVKISCVPIEKQNMPSMSPNQCVFLYEQNAMRKIPLQTTNDRAS